MDEITSMIEYTNEDCMTGMARYPDKYFDLAIVDPPYAGVTQGGYMKNQSSGGVAKHRKYNINLWSQKRPPKEYFEELKRVSKNQIIWGGNYFMGSICKDSQCWVVWNKHMNGNFADCELAYTSFDTATKMFDFVWNGMMQENMKNKEIRQHPTQKPVALYKWLLKNYAKQGDKILDTHVGSASSLIACHDMGFDAVGFELDADYFAASTRRLEQFMRQPKLIEMTTDQPEQQTLFGGGYEGTS